MIRRESLYTDVVSRRKIEPTLGGTLKKPCLLLCNAYKQPSGVDFDSSTFVCLGCAFDHAHRLYRYCASKWSTDSRRSCSALLAIWP